MSGEERSELHRRDFIGVLEELSCVADAPTVTGLFGHCGSNVDFCSGIGLSRPLEDTIGSFSFRR